MLIKLLKYDLKYMIKNMTPFYVLAIIFAVITRILFSLEQSNMIAIFANISAGCMISMVASILINVVMRSFVRFRDSIYKDEAYLTHTLPVTKNDIYNSKFIQTLIFSLFSFLIAFISILITYYKEEIWLMIKESINSISMMSDINPTLFVTIVLIVLFLEVFNAIQAGYFGIILGYSKNNSQILHSVVFGFVGYMATQTLVGIPGVIAQSFAIDKPKLILIGAVILYLLVIIIMNIICRKLLNKGVNIE